MIGDKKRKMFILTAITLASALFVTIAAMSTKGSYSFARRTDAVVNVDTPYSLILDSKWGYNGETTKSFRSANGNEFQIGFSDGTKFGGASSNVAFTTTENGLYLYNVTPLNGVTQLYVKGNSTNDNESITVYSHYDEQSYCEITSFNSERVIGSLNSLIGFEPTKYLAIRFDGIDSIESVEIGYSCQTGDAPHFAMHGGGQNIDGNGLFQSMTGLASDYSVGTEVRVKMDVQVTGTFDNESCKVYWVDQVWSSGGGESDKARTDITTLVVTGDSEWHTIEFDATIRNFPNLRYNTKYVTQSTSRFGNAVYLIAVTHASLDSFNYRNVAITKSYEPALPAGGPNNGFYQNIAPLTTEYSAGTSVLVSMDVYFTGTFDQYSGIYWVDTLYSNNLWNRSVKVVSDSDVSANPGVWYSIEFTATVRNFTAFGIFEAVDTSSYGNAVYIISRQKTLNSFNYKNVVVTKVESMIHGGANTTGNGFHQNYTGLVTEYAVGTSVNVEMDVYATGTFDQYSSVWWVDTVWTVAGGEINGKTAITSLITGEAGWHHISFVATVRDFPALRVNSSQYSVIDTSSIGNAVYLITQNKSETAFNYKNVVVTKVESMIHGGANTTGNGFHQNYAGLVTEYAVGTSVNVEMDVYATGTFDQYSSVWWVDTVWTVAGGEINGKTAITSLITGEAGWHHISFVATVRDFPALRVNSSQYSVIDTSSVGNAVYLITQNKSETAFNYKSVVITAI